MMAGIGVTIHAIEGAPSRVGADIRILDRIPTLTGIRIPRAGTRTQIAIRMSGGSTATAASRSITVTRTDTTKGVRTHATTMRTIRCATAAIDPQITDTIDGTAPKKNTRTSTVKDFAQGTMTATATRAHIARSGRAPGAAS